MRRIALLLLAMALACGAPARAGSCKEEAAAGAGKFGAALIAKQASQLRPLLPRRGKVHLALKRIAQEEGSFGAAQVEAVFHDALTRSVVRSFEVTRVESDEQSVAVVHARAELTDAQGRSGRVSLHLSFQPEDRVWVIREIKETLE